MTDDDDEGDEEPPPQATKVAAASAVNKNAVYLFFIKSICGLLTWIERADAKLQLVQLHTRSSTTLSCQGFA